MTKVTLHGALADQFGANWEFLVDQPREVVAALQSNTRGRFYEYLRRIGEETRDAVRYRVVINGRDHRSLEDLYLVGNVRTVDIIPVMAGADGGLWQAIIGVVLVVVGVVLLATGVGTALAPYVIMGGVSMLAGGVAQMLAPSPSFNASAGRAFQPMVESMGEEETKNQTSYLFSGASNTTQQGNPVPIIYGEMITGSHLASIGLSTAAIDVEGTEKDGDGGEEWPDAPVWDVIDSQTGRAALVEDPNDIQGAGMWELVPKLAPFHLTGKHSIQELRWLLITLHFVFHGPRNAVTKENAKYLWENLPGPPDLNENAKKATRGHYMLAIANYYAAN
jgi:predicted phage tail protein